MFLFLMLLFSHQACKDIFQRGISDVKPEVTHLAKGGMVAYLAYKTGGELNAIAQAYVKNSDALAVRWDFGILLC